MAAIAAMQSLSPGLRIVLLTERPDALQRGKACAAIDILRKPVPPIALRAAVTKATGAQAISGSCQP